MSESNGPASDILLTASNAMIQSGIAQNKEEEKHENNEEEDQIGGGVQPLETLPDAMQNLLPKYEEEEEEINEEEDQQVHEPIYYPNNRLDRQSKSSRAPRRSTTSRSNTANNNSQQVETTAEDPEGLAEEFEQGATLSKADSQTLAKTVIELENRRDNQQQSMKDTLRIQMAIEKAKVAQRESCKRETQKQALKENQDKQEKVKEDFRKMQQAMKEREKILEKRNNEYLEQIQAKHKDERSKLDKKWKNDITVQRRYNRSSQQLRTLRLTQERLIRAKKFSESENVGQIADRLEKDEINRNFDTMNKDYILAVKSLEDRQNEEIELAHAVMNRRLEEFQASCESKKRPYLRRLTNLKKEEEDIMASPDNVWNLRHRNDGDLVSSIVGTRKTKAAEQHSLVAKDNKYNTLQLPKLDINTGTTSAASNYRSTTQSQVSNQRSQNDVSVHDNEEEGENENNEEEGEHEDAQKEEEEEKKD